MEETFFQCFSLLANLAMCFLPSNPSLSSRAPVALAPMAVAPVAVATTLVALAMAPVALAMALVTWAMAPVAMAIASVAVAMTPVTVAMAPVARQCQWHKWQRQCSPTSCTIGSLLSMMQK